MPLNVTHDGAVAVVRLSGRLDGDAAAQLADALEQLLRDGSREAVLDLHDVDYISTPGLQAITGAQQEFAAIRGHLRIATVSPLVREAFETADMSDLIGGSPSAGSVDALTRSGLLRRSTNPALASIAGTNSWEVARNFLVRARYEVAETPFALSAASVSCRLVGDPQWAAAGEIPRASCRVVSFGEQSFGLGIGALGRDIDQALPRLGEMVGAQGVVAAQPTAGATLPDFLLGPHGHAAEAVMGSGMVLDGPFARTVRFTHLPDHDAVSLSEVANVCCEIAKGVPTAIVMMAEVSGLVGAWLRRSPAGDKPGFTTRAPAVRDWLALTPARVQEGTSALIVGVVSKEKSAGALAPWLRPLGGRTECVGHFHAAVFSFRPVPLRTVQPRVLVTKYFTQQRTRAVLHLLTDDRGPTGAGESELLRGICWSAPVGAIETVA
jgi:anti-anti-sigma factor